MMFNKRLNSHLKFSFNLSTKRKLKKNYCGKYKKIDTYYLS